MSILATVLAEANSLNRHNVLWHLHLRFLGMLLYMVIHPGWSVKLSHIQCPVLVDKKDTICKPIASVVVFL